MMRLPHRPLRALLYSAAILGAAIVQRTALTQSTKPSPGRQAAPSLYRIAGAMTNAATGEPIRHASVAILAVEDSHTVAAVESDGEGHFAFDRIPAAKYQLTASKRGFRTSFYDQHEDFNTAIVTGPGQDTTNLAFRLMPGGTLHGVITTEGGEPVENARVMLFLKSTEDKSSARPTQSDAATTDDTGAYELTDLAPGDYFLAVIAEPWYALHRNAARGGDRAAEGADPAAALDVAYPITYFDASTDEATATALTVSGGSRQQADITLHAVPALHIQVETPRRNGGSIARAELRQTIFGTVVGAESAGFLDAMQTGATEFTGVAPGHYELTQGDPPRVTQLDATASQQIDATLGAATVAVRGTFSTPAGAPLSQEAALMLEPAPGAPNASPIQGASNQGAFEFHTVPPGEWQLTAESGGQQLSIVSIAAGGRIRRGNAISVPDHALSVVVTVAQGDTRVEGFARKDGKPAAGAMIVLVPNDTATLQSLGRRDQSDSDGSFALRDVVPGRYTVVAIADGWPLDWTDPHVLARYLLAGVPVTVTDRAGKLTSLSIPVPVQSR